MEQKLGVSYKMDVKKSIPSMIEKAISEGQSGACDLHDVGSLDSVRVQVSRISNKIGVKVSVRNNGIAFWLELKSHSIMHDKEFADAVGVLSRAKLPSYLVTEEDVKSVQRVLGGAFAKLKEKRDLQVKFR